LAGDMMVFNKKAQLGMIEFKFYLFGLIGGIVVGLVLIFLGTAGTIPFTIPVC
jgi:hypothetical protein